MRKISIDDGFILIVIFPSHLLMHFEAACISRTKVHYSFCLFFPKLSQHFNDLVNNCSIEIERHRSDYFHFVRLPPRGNIRLQGVVLVWNL